MKEKPLKFAPTYALGARFSMTAFEIGLAPAANGSPSDVG